MIDGSLEYVRGLRRRKGEGEEEEGRRGGGR